VSTGFSVTPSQHARFSTCIVSRIAKIAHFAQKKTPLIDVEKGRFLRAQNVPQWEKE